MAQRLNTYLNAITGSVLSATIVAWRRLSPIQVLGQSGVAATAPVNATENILATISLPAATILANDALEITTMWSMTASTNAKTCRIRLGGIGGTQFLNTAQTGGTTVALQNLIIIRFPTTATQKAWNAGNTGVYATGTGAATTGVIDMTALQTLVITGQKALDSETLTPETTRRRTRACTVWRSRSRRQRAAYGVAPAGSAKSRTTTGISRDILEPMVTISTSASVRIRKAKRSSLSTRKTRRQESSTSTRSSSATGPRTTRWEIITVVFLTVAALIVAVQLLG